MMREARWCIVGHLYYGGGALRWRRRTGLRTSLAGLRAIDLHEIEGQQNLLGCRR